MFPNPEVYYPERWLDATPEMRDMSRPFSYGPRNCVGKHLAQIGLVLTLARLYQVYDLENGRVMTDEGMRYKDRGVAAPWDGRVIVKPRRAR